MLIKKNQRQTGGCKPSDIWKVPITCSPEPKEVKRCTPGEKGDFVNRCGVYAKCQLKPLGSFVHQRWVAHRAQKREAEETSRKTIPVTPAVPQLAFEHLLYSLGQQRREPWLRRHTL